MPLKKVQIIRIVQSSLQTNITIKTLLSGKSFEWSYIPCQ